MKVLNNISCIIFIIFFALFNTIQCTSLTLLSNLNDNPATQVFVGEVVWNATGEYRIWLKGSRRYFIFIRWLIKNGIFTVLNPVNDVVYQEIRNVSANLVFAETGFYRVLIDGLCNFVLLEAVHTYVDGEVVILEEELSSERNYIYGYYVLAGPEPDKWTAIRIEIKAPPTANLQVMVLNREFKTLRVENVLAGKEVSFILGPPCHRSIIIVKCTSGSGKYVLKVNSYTHKTYITESMFIVAIILAIIGAIIKSKWL